MKKLADILKTVEKYRALGAEVIILTSAIGALIGLPVLVVFVVLAGIWIMCGIIRNSYSLFKRLRYKKKRLAKQREIYRKLKLELDEIKHKLKIHNEHRPSPAEVTFPSVFRIHFFDRPREEKVPCNEPILNISSDKVSI